MLWSQEFAVGRTFGASLKFELVEAGVICLANGIVKVELGGEIPFARVGIMTTSMQTEQCLIRLHG